ncbi:unnamed protein product [Caenorhabditis brenneri]
MNLLILSLLFVVVSSHVYYPGDAGSSYPENHLYHFNLTCTDRCTPGQTCVDGSCQAEQCKIDDDCDTWAFCEDGRCWSICSDVVGCSTPMICIKGRCGIKMRPSSLNHHQFNRRSFRAGCAAPCGPGTTCMMGHCVQDAG